MPREPRSYAIVLYKERAAFIDQINQDYEDGGVSLVRYKMRLSDWLFLMGLYDTMFIRVSPGHIVYPLN